MTTGRINQVTIVRRKSGQGALGTAAFKLARCAAAGGLAAQPEPAGAVPPLAGIGHSSFPL